MVNKLILNEYCLYGTLWDILFRFKNNFIDDMMNWDVDISKFVIFIILIIDSNLDFQLGMHPVAS